MSRRPTLLGGDNVQLRKFAVVARRDSIAFTSRLDEILAIDYGHMTTAVSNQTLFLQISRYNRHGGPLCSDHLCQILLRKVQHARPDPILGGQEPARQPCLCFMQTVAACDLADAVRLLLRALQNPLPYLLR